MEIEDNYALLMSANENNNKFSIQCVNYNNQDILLHLSDGYVQVKYTKGNVYKFHHVKPAFYTIPANRVSNIEIEIYVTRDEAVDEKYMFKLSFDYHNGIFRKQITVNG